MTGIDVKIWMMTKGIKARDIADQYDCDESFVSRFLTGKKTSKALANHLIRKGCPKKYFKNGKVAA
jgi:hypothetical protein